MTQRAAVAACLDRVVAPDLDLAPFRAALMWPQDPCARSTLPGHFTASLALIVRGSGLVMIRHRYLKRWLLPGGHIEPGETPGAAARRELLEETGIVLDTTLSPVAHDINAHPIPANPAKGEPAHDHYDLRFLFVTDTQTRPKPRPDEVVAACLMSRRDVQQPEMASVLGRLLTPILDHL